MKENTLHNYGLVRFSKKTGKIDTCMTAIGKGLIQLWALQNTPKTKACVIIDIDEERAYAEYIGTEDGFPKITKDQDEMMFIIPVELYAELQEEAQQNADPAPR